MRAVKVKRRMVLKAGSVSVLSLASCVGNIDANALLRDAGRFDRFDAGLLPDAGLVNDAGVSADGGTSNATNDPPEPPANLTASARVSLSTSADAALIASYPENTGFWLPNGTYTKLINVVPKNGMSFVGESTSGVILNGGGGSATYAFSGKANNVVIARMTITNYLGAGTNQSIGPINGKTGTDYYGSDSAAKDWYIYQLNILNNGGTGIALGHRFKVVGGRIEGQNPTGLSGDRITGGLVHSVSFKNNGFQGASGAAENNAQIKMTWLNCGPLGQADRDSSVWVDILAKPMQPQKEIPTTFRVVNCTFDCKSLSGGSNGRAIWFDLDCRNSEVTQCTFTDAGTFGVFNEGCNGSFIHHNRFVRCGANMTLPGGGQSWQNAYFSYAAVVCGSSSNIVVEDNIFENCPMAMIEFLGDRGRNGADWAPGGGYQVASAAWNYMIRPIYTPIGIGERSAVGSSNNKWRRNTLLGSSKCVGTVFGPNINTSTEANLNTSEWSGNVYTGSSQEMSQEFCWNRQKMDFATWKAAGRL